MDISTINHSEIGCVNGLKFSDESLTGAPPCRTSGASGYAAPASCTVAMENHDVFFG